MQAPFVMVALMLGVFAMFVLWKFGVESRRRAYLRELGPSREPLPRTPECPRCRGRMVTGYVLDRKHGGCSIATWVEGWPDKPGWTDNVRPRMERSIPIVTFRCTGCGMLEHYARPEFGLDERTDGGKKPAGYSEL